jgi:hypothetical protein
MLGWLRTTGVAGTQLGEGPMQKRILGHIRSNVVGYVALFFSLSLGTAYAADTIGSSDVIDESLLTQDFKNGEVKNADLGTSAVTGAKVLASTLTGSDVAADTLSKFDIGANAVGPDELAQAPGARAVSTTTQAIANNAGPTVTLDTEVFDTGNLYTAPNDSITISVPGTYLLSGEVGFAANSNGVRSTRILVGTTHVAVNQTVGTSPAITRVPVSTIARLAAGNVVTLQAVQGSGASLNTANFSSSQLGDAYLAVQWLGR